MRKLSFLLISLFVLIVIISCQTHNKKVNHEIENNVITKPEIKEASPVENFTKTKGEEVIPIEETNSKEEESVTFKKEIIRIDHTGPDQSKLDSIKKEKLKNKK